ncbi:hypothetical protein A2V80_02385 [Candidatus Woesebacteria bacterium RBG_16_39_8b]|uniref:Uncharacterized protein n=1 Tax=Candidatus Woesebacteria bacterium RBG_16_39_8b TaxID=1802482 RepID=A0A1F7X9C3_9BACT|nr:MAG: hypothetical protein A2V80_02385 [Candidatus Woesebacteria bacterium RBG_16_39_8b]
MSVEKARITTQDCFELVNKHYRRDLTEAEENGLLILIEQHVSNDIYGRVLDIIREKEKFQGLSNPDDKKVVMIDEDIDGSEGIHEFIYLNIWLEDNKITSTLC